MTQGREGLSGIQLHYVDSVDKAQEFLRWLGERRPHDALSVDIETGEYPGGERDHALSPWHGQIRLAQVGDAMQGWAIPWDEWSGVFYQGMIPFEGQIVCHNIAFEAKWFSVKSRWKFPWHLAHDTMIMAHLIDPLGSGALKQLAALHVDQQAVSLQSTLDGELAKNGWTWGTVPTHFQPYWSYGALDTILTMRLWELFYPRCAPGGPYSKAYELEMATRRIVTSMEVNGARVDLDYSKRKYEELVSYTEQVKNWAQSTYSTSITSNVQLVRLFERLGGEISEYTPTGQKSCTKDQLKLFTITGNPEVKALAETVLAQRKADKLASSYFLNFLNKSIGGYVHPSVRTLGARTGRMSITDPALQTLPSGEATVRKAFVPKDDDHVIISSDLDQVEFRLTAALSEDPDLIRLFLEADATGGDAFTSIMRDIYQDPTAQKSDPRRKLVKGCVPLSSTILTKRGWLPYDEVKPGDETLGYDFTTGKSRWTEVLGVHVFDDSDIYRLSNQHRSFLCTEDHRWVADNGRGGPRGTAPEIIYANEFVSGDKRLILAATTEDGDLDVSPEEAFLLGWILGDGSIKRSEYTGRTSQAGGSRVGCLVKIFQTKPTGVQILSEVMRSIPHSLWVNKKTQQHAWTLDPNYARDLLSRAGIYNKQEFDPWSLSSGLTSDARMKMLEGLDLADGKRPGYKYPSIVQAANSPVVELIEALAYMTGRYTRTAEILPDEASGNWQRSPIKVVYVQKGSMTNQRATLEYVTTDRVWCVTTELGTWTMRQEGGSPVLTGNTVYGKLYGAGPAKMALTAGVSEAQMREVVDAFDAAYPGVKRLQKTIENIGTQRLRSEGQGYVLTRTGRRLPCDDDRVYSLTNYLVQSSAAEVFKANLIKLDQADLTDMMIVPVHDEIVLQVPRSDALEVMELVKQCMTTSDGWAVPLTAGVDGPFETWGDKYDEGA